MRRISLSIVGVLSLIVAGCSNFGLGSSEYGCPGLPKGIQCMSARTAYQLTDERDSLETRPLTTAATSEAGEQEGSRSASEQMRGEQVRGGATPVVQAAAVPAGPVPAVLPDGSVPVRSPSHVMRVWVAPYETKQGDLVMSGYLYTEVVPRRWQVGLPSPESQRVLSPLNAGAVRKDKTGS